MKKLYKSILAMALAIAPAFALNAAVSEWCDTPYGHLGNPDFGDVNGRILLTIENTATDQLTVTIKPAPTSTKTGHNYLRVEGSALVAPVYVGTQDSDDPDEVELSVVVPLTAGTVSVPSLTLYWSYAGWGGCWMATVENVDPTATCGGGCELTENPTMISADVLEKTTTNALVDVAGKDQNNDDITKFVINGKTYIASDGRITIDGLNPGTDYSFDIYAKDACGNISDKSVTVEVYTQERTSECSGQKGHFATPDNMKINYTIVESDSKATITISPVESTSFNKPSEQNPAAVLFVNGAGYNMTVADDLSKATYEYSVSESTAYYVTFQYSLDGMPGMEQTANPVCDPATAIFFIGGECMAASVAETSVSAVNIYPNPAKDIVNVEADAVIGQIDIYSILGVNVASVKPESESAVINVANLASGRYVVIVTTESGKAAKSLIVE